MSSLNCLVCNKEFVPYRSTQKYCTRICYKKSDRYKDIIKKFNKTEKRKITQRKYKKNSDKYKNYMSEYLKKYSMTDKNKKYRQEYGLKYRQRDDVKEYQKKYRQSEKYKENQRKYAQTNKRKEYKKEYRKTEKYKNWVNEYFSERKKNDPVFKIQIRMRQRIGNFLKVKKLSKKNTTFKMIGCTPEFLKIYLEKKFYPHPKTNEKMTWKNHTLHGWHVDHIKPLDMAKTISEAEKLSHYTNLQPMWADENISKGNKY